jgi:hypothetical protein
MTKRTPPAYPIRWKVTEETTLNGHHVTPGTELSVRGERGRFRFLRRIDNGNGADWIDVYGGPKGSEQLRSFYPERVKTVHRLKTTDKALVAARKASK